MVKTFSYDSLNRVTQISYNTVSGVTTAPTVTFVYDSDSTYSTTGDGMLLRVNVGSDYQERYTLDSSFPGRKHDSNDRKPNLHDQRELQRSEPAEAVDVSFQPGHQR